MLGMAAPSGIVFRRRMANASAHPTPSDEAEALGRAIQSIRERVGLSQEQLAERMGVARQTVSRYETGRSALLRIDLQRQITDALGVTVEDLIAERDNVVHPDFKARTISPPESARAVQARTTVAVHAQPEIGEDGEIHYVEVPPLSSEDLGWLFGPNAGFIRLAEGSLPEGAFSARVAGYDKSAWPRTGQGCVIETRDGELLPRIYERRTQAGLSVRAGEPLGTHTVAYTNIKGVYAIRFYGD